MARDSFWSLFLTLCYGTLIFTTQVATSSGQSCLLEMSVNNEHVSRTISFGHQGVAVLASCGAMGLITRDGVTVGPGQSTAEFNLSRQTQGKYTCTGGGCQHGSTLLLVRPTFGVEKDQTLTAFKGDRVETECIIEQSDMYPFTGILWGKKTEEGNREVESCGEESDDDDNRVCVTGTGALLFESVHENSSDYVCQSTMIDSQRISPPITSRPRRVVLLAHPKPRITKTANLWTCTSNDSTPQPNDRYCLYVENTTTGRVKPLRCKTGAYVSMTLDALRIHGNRVTCELNRTATGSTPIRVESESVTDEMPTPTPPTNDTGTTEPLSVTSIVTPMVLVVLAAVGGGIFLLAVAITCRRRRRLHKKSAHDVETGSTSPQDQEELPSNPNPGNDCELEVPGQGVSDQTKPSAAPPSSIPIPWQDHSIELPSVEVSAAESVDSRVSTYSSPLRDRLPIPGCPSPEAAFMLQKYMLSKFPHANQGMMKHAAPIYETINEGDGTSTIRSNMLPNAPPCPAQRPCHLTLDGRQPTKRQLYGSRRNSKSSLLQFASKPSSPVEQMHNYRSPVNGRTIALPSHAGTQVMGYTDFTKPSPVRSAASTPASFTASQQARLSSSFRRQSSPAPRVQTPLGISARADHRFTPSPAPNTQHQSSAVEENSTYVELTPILPPADRSTLEWSSGSNTSGGIGFVRPKELRKNELLQNTDSALGSTSSSQCGSPVGGRQS